MAKLRMYNPTDYEQIAVWFLGWGKKPMLKKYIPETGYIFDGVAAGFLYMTDGQFGILDCYIANPKASKEDRDSALDQITERLIAAAKDFGLKALKCDTKLETIKKRALEFGFIETGQYTSFMREI